jgi:ATP-dependent DNA helicase RecQ
MVLVRDGYRCRDCGEPAARRDLDVHHLVRRADGGRDEVSNCITLCDGCHAARHPHLQMALSRRMMERWALRLARWLDRTGELPDETRALEAGLRIFNVERFRDGQLDAVLGALRGESLLVIRQTGAGKSLCFQLPAVLKGQPATFVLSPLKALMVDQVTGLQRRKVPATFINSDIVGSEKEQRYRMLENGGLSLLYVTPERFHVRPQEVERLTRQRPNFLVVDEAHVVDRWGDDFRPAYSRIADIRR